MPRKEYKAITLTNGLVKRIDKLKDKKLSSRPAVIKEAISILEKYCP